jgi:hypothetical protein
MIEAKFAASQNYTGPWVKVGMRKVRCTRGKIGPFNPAIPIAGDRLRLHQHGSTQTVDLVE